MRPFLSRLAASRTDGTDPCSTERVRRGDASRNVLTLWATLARLVPAELKQGVRMDAQLELSLGSQVLDYLEHGHRRATVSSEQLRKRGRE